MFSALHIWVTWQIVWFRYATRSPVNESCMIIHMHCIIVCPTGTYLLKTSLCIKPILVFLFFFSLDLVWGSYTCCIARESNNKKAQLLAKIKDKIAVKQECRFKMENMWVRCMPLCASEQWLIICSYCR